MTNYFDTLPNETVVHIMDLLDLKSLIECRKMSRRLRNMVAMTPLWKEWVATKYSYEVMKKLMKKKRAEK